MPPFARLVPPIAIAVTQGGFTVLAAGLVHDAARLPVRTLPLTVAVLAVAGSFGLEVCKRRLCDGIGWAHVNTVRTRLFAHLLRSDPQVVATKRHGALLQVFVGDLSAQRQWWSDGVPRGATAIVMLAVLVCWSAMQSPALAAWVAAIVSCGIAAGLALVPWLNKAVAAVRRERGRLSAFASERLAGMATVQAFGQHKAELRRLDRRADRLTGAALRRAWLTGILRGLPHLVTSLILIAVLVGSGGISGTIIVLGTAGLAMRDLARVIELWIPARISNRRIARLMAMPEPASAAKGRQTERAGHGLALRGVGIAGSSARFDAWAAAGDVVTIEGETALVSRIMRVVAGLESPAQGRASYNMIETARLPASRRRKLIGLVSPGLPLLAGSNRFNIRYGALGFEENALEAACTCWGVDPSAQTTATNATAVMLLRALVGARPLLVLDLAGIALDKPHASLLAETIARHDGVVLIAHAPALLEISASQNWRITRDGFAVTVPRQNLRLIESAGDPR